MPNHVANRLYFECSDERLEEILTAVQYDPEPESEETTGIGTLDFNKLVPMPESLSIESGSTTDAAIEVYLTAINPKTADHGVAKASPEFFSELLERMNKQRIFGTYRADLSNAEIMKTTGRYSRDEMIQLGKTAVSNFISYGAATWYDWCISNWGTKWNSYYPDKSFADGVSFSTAWSAPEPVIKALSERFPDVVITHEWADEDIGRNLGRREYEGGECIGEYIPESEKECIEFALAVRGCSPEEYGLSLNASGSGYVYMSGEEYELIDVLGQPALFTEERLSKDDIPAGMYVCHIRGIGAAAGSYTTIEPEVMVNHAGSVITLEPIDFGAQGYIVFTEDTAPNFMGESITFKDFRDGDYEPEPDVGQTDGMS